MEYDIAFGTTPLSGNMSPADQAGARQPLSLLQLIRPRLDVQGFGPMQAFNLLILQAYHPTIPLCTMIESPIAHMM